jgi:hypothetical protein
MSILIHVQWWSALFVRLNGLTRRKVVTTHTLYRGAIELTRARKAQDKSERPLTRSMAYCLRQQMNVMCGRAGGGCLLLGHYQRLLYRIARVGHLHHHTSASILQHLAAE